jgi:hypothetical protein
VNWYCFENYYLKGRLFQPKNMGLPGTATNFDGQGPIISTMFSMAGIGGAYTKKRARTGYKGGRIEHVPYLEDISTDFRVLIKPGA